ncbi:S1 RNA-binding domain-containing protein [Sandaracinus amylolyticus]|uniref:SSU ribosomal protein S1p n=1 Tax=Sandaracinus amylolyticus TaxID=927083 RepID=A0A0F6YKG1_9BACT|nr:S1 RNA-binding domain-containing protein [Sandaracinus amylolyticus]AKF08326.1 SSU ribosomal protein S1p [Sandaracinus amylolyticus]
MSSSGGRKGESFADLFARGDVPVAKQRRLSVGEEVEGVVGHVGPDSVFVDLDDKQQGYFESIDLKDARGEMTVKVGDRVKAWVVGLDGGQIKLGKRFGRDVASTDRFRAAFEQGAPVEGKVTGVNKGGAEVDLGGIRGFCPFSQLDNQYVQDPSTFIGRSLSFVITKLDDRDVVLSRRQLLEREAKDARERVLATLAIGSTVKGRVSQLREFGAFVDLGGIEGLIPMRELSHDRVKPEDVVQLGDVVEVQVKNVEKKTTDKGEKVEITLSLKALAADPWSAIEAVAPVGKVVAGQVSRLAEFGAFVRIASGVEGLLHVSELGARVRRPEEAVQIGQSLLVRVLSVDVARKRIALAPASEGAAVGAEDRGGAGVIVGSVVKAIVEKVENYGVVCQLAGTKGRAGRAVIPNAETGTRLGADLRKEFPVGREVTAKVIEASDNRTRISIKAAVEDAERADFDSFRAKGGGSGMGTLGDLLKKKLGKS